jgi:hypothetical protein
MGPAAVPSLRCHRPFFADADELLKLAQAAQQLQQQQGIDPSSYAALQQQGLDWSGFAAGMPMAMGAQAGLMNSGYYWPTQGFPQQQYQQKHTSLSKLEHASRWLRSCCCMKGSGCTPAGHVSPKTAGLHARVCVACCMVCAERTLCAVLATCRLQRQAPWAHG